MMNCRQDMSFGERPLSAVHDLPVYRETFKKRDFVSKIFNALEELLPNSSRTALVAYCQPSDFSTPTGKV